jgi:predicted Mrr-cat superfamily restriction endonuclease
LGKFLSEGIVAIGWPQVGDLSGCLTREQMAARLCAIYPHYNAELRNELSVAAGILLRFANEMNPGDCVMVPDEPDVYIGEITSGYIYRPELRGEDPDAGYPHWHKVSFLNGKKPFCVVNDLPLGVRRAIDCHLTVFAINKGAQATFDFIESRRQPPPKKDGPTDTLAPDA